MTDRTVVSGRSWPTEQRGSRSTWHDGDLRWLGLLLSVLSAVLVVTLVGWLVV